MSADLPAVLVSPRWLDRPKPKKVKVELTPVVIADHMAWPEGLQATWSSEPRWATPDRSPRTLSLHLGVSEVALSRLERGEVLTTEDLGPPPRWVDSRLLLHLSPRAALPLVALRAKAVWVLPEEALQLLVLEHGLALLDALLVFAGHHAHEGLRLLLPYASMRVAAFAAHAASFHKRARAPARAWLEHHPEVATAALIAPALDRPSKARDAAAQALRHLVKAGHAAIVMAVAERAGARDAIRELIDRDPLDVLPTRMPELPEWAAAATLPPLVLKSGERVPPEATRHALTMLQISELDAPYAGVASLNEACTPPSLATFGWELFQAWLAAGAPAKDSWAMTQLAHLGDDLTTRKLVTHIKAWPGQAANARALLGLDVLAAIGTDTALMHIHRLSTKAQFKALRSRAEAKIAEIAEARDLSEDQLADRIVPDLGLDDDGSLVLDFGPRQFRVGFDESLQPFVQDAAGARLSDLPRPIKADDEALAKVARETWKVLKKEAKTIATEQLRRLEHAMARRRRWRHDELRQCLVEHPLLGHLVRRLVWGVYDGDRLQQPFRVAEDRTFADIDDATLVLAQDAAIGVVHVLDLDAGQVAALTQVFDDYGILPPFKQLLRETFTLTPVEAGRAILDRWRTRAASPAAFFGLETRGWTRSGMADWSTVTSFETQVTVGGLRATVVLRIGPGVWAGRYAQSGDQTVETVGFDDPELELGALHPIVVSEIVRDVELLMRRT